MSMILPSQAYELKLAPQPAPFSILTFTGLDRISQLYRYEIEFTSPVAGIPMDQVLGRPAKFVVDPVDPDMAYLRKMFGESAGQFSKKPPAYTVHGVITRFDEIETSADETRYRVVLEPTLADLDRGVTSRLFQKQSVEEIVTDTLRHYGYRAGVDFQFQLRGEYKRREYVTQYRETTFAFIQRLCAEGGIWFRWEQKKDRAVVVFGDDLDAYARKQRVVPHRSDSGLDSVGADAIKTLGRETQRVPEAVRLHDYNHRQAGVSLLVEENTARDDKTTNAVDYHWGEHYETPEEGNRIARLRHEAYLAGQITFKGTGNPFWLEAGEVMRIDPKPVDAKHGVFVTSVESRGGRSESYWVTFEGIPSDRVWRTPVASVSRPVVDGILPARITSPGDYKYAYLTEQGWYVIKLPFDLDEWSPGGTSRPVRFAKPYSGDDYGHHFPLIDGAEVAIVHTDGDPNRPVIIGAMHDSLHPDLVNNLNHTRNIVRTAARNELRMEDKEGIEHVHLTTPYQTSELNLGHMVDDARNERGKGAELRTSGHLAVRGPKGMLLTTEAQAGASGHQLDMRDAQAQLQRAIERMESLADAVRAAEATVAELQEQKALYAEALDGLKRGAILMSAPSGIGLTSGDHFQVNADRNLIATAGGNFDVGTMKNFTVAAGRQVSLFAQAQGVRVTAGKQDVVIQARTGAMALAASKDMHFTSVDGSILATSGGALTLTSGGAYLKIDGGNIELGCPGDITLKCGNFRWTGPNTLSVPRPAMPIGPCRECLLDAQRGVEAMTEVA
ncbi:MULTISPECIES: type VI secretion system Vgr family protein [unclassified Burkholderia]|uniref:type VI secretion system Vgr family protein n=1 Tax=unclassified Burkholderia TaxID=2613784 RepID=UPI000F56F1E5|nr:MULTISPECIES: type VI secretion system Vgr family protein [unclassified Burkholderia]RQR42167.1 type VI secretion system tip protein VgrG [Burkholderia sp. Bp9142]RQR56559.1 type VI secretion system tip protein VgrG [Burkholderia sp. Bp9140]